LRIYVKLNNISKYNIIYSIVINFNYILRKKHEGHFFFKKKNKDLKRESSRDKPMRLMNYLFIFFFIKIEGWHIVDPTFFI